MDIDTALSAIEEQALAHEGDAVRLAGEGEYTDAIKALSLARRLRKLASDLQSPLRAGQNRFTNAHPRPSFIAALNAARPWRIGEDNWDGFTQQQAVACIESARSERNLNDVWDEVRMRALPTHPDRPDSEVQGD